MAETFTLRLLGAFDCRRAGMPVVVSGKKTRALLAYLALSAGQVHAREKLAALLWGDRFDKQARQSLRQAVAALRRELGDDLFVGDREQLGIVADALDLDVPLFRAACADPSPEAARRALSLYRGDLLADVGADPEEFHSWLAVERQRLRLLAADACERLARYEAGAGRADEAVAAAQRLVDLDPAEESSHRLLAEILARFRGPAPALRQLQAGIGIVRRELDAEPSAETLQLAATLRQQEPPGARAESVAVAPPAAGAAGAARPVRRVAGATALIAATAAAAMLLWGAFEQPGRSSLAPPNDASVHPQPHTMRLMVLPFDDHGVPEARRLAATLSEDLTTDLSLISGMFVIAHATSRAYRPGQIDPRQVGRELGVNFVLSGGVRPVEDGFRINVALVDTGTGAQVWAQHFRIGEAGRQQLQDEIVSAMMASLHVEMTLLEGARSARERPDSTALDDLLVRGRAARMRGPSPENIREALGVYTKAVELAPNAAWAVSGLAASLVLSVVHNQSAQPERDLERASALIERALEESPRCYFCWHVKALILNFSGRFTEAVAASERSIEINPNYPYPHGQLASILLFLGRAEASAAHVERALKLSPRDPLVPIWLTVAGHGQLLLGNDAKAVDILRQAAQGKPRYARLYRMLAIALLLTGDEPGAREAMATFRALTVRSVDPASESSAEISPVYRTQQARLAAALRQAGF